MIDHEYSFVSGWPCMGGAGSTHRTLAYAKSVYERKLDTITCVLGMCIS